MNQKYVEKYTIFLIFFFDVLHYIYANLCGVSVIKSVFWYTISTHSNEQIKIALASWFRVRSHGALLFLGIEFYDCSYNNIFEKKKLICKLLFIIFISLSYY